MPTTDPAERFKRIFANTEKPALPDPAQVHIADLELAEPISAKPDLKPFKIPDVPQVKRKFYQPDRSNARDIISSSEDEDDYVNAFKSNTKPKMLEPSKNKGGRKRLGDASITHINLPGHLSDSSEDASPSLRYPEGFENAAMESVSKLPTADVDGNKAIGHFCVFILVAKFPYKYMKDPNDKVSKRFFAYNKFYERKWDIYYLHPPQDMYAQPIIMLHIKQVQQLLDEISAAFKINVELPHAPFAVSFFDDNTPQPIFLGQTCSREEYNELATSMPLARDGHGECPEDASEKQIRAFNDFRSKCEEARTANKKGKTKKQEKRAQEKLVALREASGGLRRTQRYFGLRPKSREYVAPDQSLSWEEQNMWELAQAKKAGVLIEPLDVNKKTPYPFEKNVVIIAFDVEANEHAHHLITEIGVSTLDTEDIKDIAPGPGGENWIKNIRSRHFRIKEHSHMRNKTFITGNPDGFDFGNSEFVSLKTGEAVEAVDQCFTFPYSEGFQHDGTKGFQSKTKPHGSSDRRVVLLGHDVQTDIDYLNKLGSKIFISSLKTYPPVARHEALKSVEEALDVAILYKVLKKEDNPRSLGSVMTDLDRDPWGLHNGGNDARYTLECLVGLAIKARLEDDAKSKKDTEEKERIAKEMEKANAAWAAPITNPLSSSNNIRPLPIYVNTDNTEEVEVTNVKHPDLPHTPNAAVNSLLPGKGRHYGSDNELDRMSDDDEWFGEPAKAADTKLKLDGGANDNESDFEM